MTLNYRGNTKIGPGVVYFYSQTATGAVKFSHSQEILKMVVQPAQVMDKWSVISVATVS